MTETFSSKSTDSFRELLTLGKCNILVTTYQAGQVVMIRPQGQGINTHFMSFDWHMLPRPDHCALAPLLVLAPLPIMTWPKAQRAWLKSAY